MWQQYAKAFVEDSGRVVDDYHKMTHSEGQGSGMLFAVMANDRTAFERIYSWTERHLRRPDGLYAWKWQDGRVADINNASDGDILIAWSLLKAYEAWGDEVFLQKSLALLDAIKLLLVTREYGFTVLLPGSLYYEKPERTVINPSYIVLPALVDFARYDDATFWNGFYQDSLQLLKRASALGQGVTTDWMQVSEQGLAYSEEHDPVFGYDAIRVPLYLAWANERALLQPYLSLWNKLGGVDKAPSTYHLLDGGRSAYSPEHGIVAIRKLAANLPLPNEPGVAAQGYYSSSLVLFAHLASHSQAHP
nr:glycosyl hydrolase family 8 [Microbulbifer sp. CAU 1566]